MACPVLDFATETDAFQPLLGGTARRTKTIILSAFEIYE
jgi:hypothetical protein